MMYRTLASLLLTTFVATDLLAQNCSDNLYRLRLVDSQGVEVTNSQDPSTGIYNYTFANDGVYLAFDPMLPSGTYYVHVTDPIGLGDEVLSQNDPMDRFVSVTNNAGVISLSLPFTNGQTPPVFGLGFGGVGQSLRLSPFSSSVDEPCRFKAWMGDCWDLSLGPSNPYLLMGGFSTALNRCCVRSYADFTVGNGAANDIVGSVFLDANGNGQRDAGEGGVANVPVLLAGSGTGSTATGSTGNYAFLAVGQGNFQVSITLGSGFLATTPTTVNVSINNCANARADFGVRQAVVARNGHTIGFWRNNNGRALVTQFQILPTLSTLNLVNAAGTYVAPSTLTAWASWLQGANATNMAYMLSAQLAAMHCNVLVGFVSPFAVVNGGSLGNLSIASLMQQAIASLALYPSTPTGHPQRAAQEALKNALDAANNNQNWL